MKFLYNQVKAVQAAAYMVRLHGGHMDVLVLIKLLYLADRKALIDSGYPITGDSMVSMPHGPVLCGIYDSIKWNDSPWCDYITERSHDEVSLRIQEPDTGELSDYEAKVLETIHEHYGHMGPWDLRRLTHELPEYEDPHGSSYPIEPADILRHAGKSDHEIEILTREAEEFRTVGRLLRTPSA